MEKKWNLRTTSTLLFSSLLFSNVATSAFLRKSSKFYLIKSNCSVSEMAAVKTAASLVVSKPDSETEAAALSTESSKVNSSAMSWLIFHSACIFINHDITLRSYCEKSLNKWKIQNHLNMFFFFKHSSDFQSEKPQVRHLKPNMSELEVKNMSFQSTELHCSVLYITAQARPPSLIYELDHINSSAIVSGCLWTKRNIFDLGKY